MVRVEKYLPNLMTFGNLFCGFFGILCCFHGDTITAGLLIFGGAIFDVFDGMAARLVKSSSPIGAELDSMADVVTFGVLPASIMHVLILSCHQNWIFEYRFYGYPIASLVPFLIVAGAAYRLAKFNVDTTQTNTFVGLPSPSNGIFFASLPLILQNDTFILSSDVIRLEHIILNGWVLLGMCCLLSWLMVCNIRMFSFKLKSFKWKDSKVVYIFLAIDIILFVLLLWAAIPLIIFLYIILSILTNPKNNEVQSAN